MKKTAFLILGILLTTSSFATIWRLNSNINIDADFRTLQGANDSSSVSAGDTLYCENGSFLGDATITKSLTIIGPGYFLAQNDSTYPNPASAIVGTITFDSAAAGSQLIGMTITNVIRINYCNNLIIERCRINEMDDDIFGNQPYNNLTVRQCYFENSGSTLVVDLNKATSAFFQNNIIRGPLRISGVIQSLDFSNNAAIHQSTGYVCDFENANVYNNIIINQNSSYEAVSSNSLLNSSNNSLTKNVLSSDTNVNFPNNYFDAIIDSVFTLQGNQEEQLELKSNSPAIGYGTTGGDCGVYGGVYAYVKSGLPLGLPRIFEATIPSRVDASSGVNVNIKVKIQDE